MACLLCEPSVTSQSPPRKRKQPCDETFFAYFRVDYHLIETVMIIEILHVSLMDVSFGVAATLCLQQSVVTTLTEILAFCCCNTVSFLLQISSREHEHLNDLSQIAFLVIDECDRMTEQGSFPQLHSILDTVEKANPMDEDDDDDDANNEDISDDEDLDDPDRLLSLPGVKGEARVVMLNDDILARIEQQKTGKAPSPFEDSESVMIDDDEENDEDFSPDEELALPLHRPVERQTFVYSATLTLPPSASYIPSRDKRKKRMNLKGLEGAIEEILDKARARGQTKIIDLSNSKKQAKFNEKILETHDKSKRENVKPSQEGRTAAVVESKFNLPPGLKLQEIKCIQMHKDSHLYAYLLTTREGASGPCLVFCNSIAAVKRVGKTLELLGLPVRVLHANMQQVRRYSIFVYCTVALFLATEFSL